MNVIILGCGLISGRWIRALDADPRVTVAALVDSDPQAAAAVAGRGGLDGVPWFSDLGSALDAITAGIVVNLLPADVHAGYSLAALEQGLHVFTEKPLALSLGEAQALVGQARARELVLAVMSNRGRDRRFLAFRDLVHATGTGPFAVSAEVFVRLPKAGFRSRLAFPAIADLAVHAFDQIGQLIPVAPTTVTCGETPLHALGGHCSIAAATVQFTDGSVFSFRGGYSGPGHRTSADGHWRVDFAGAGLRWDGADTAMTGRDTGTGQPSLTHLPASDGHGPRIAAMIDAVFGGPAPPDGLGSIVLLDAALRSARTGGPVQVMEVRS